MSRTTLLLFSLVLLFPIFPMGAPLEGAELRSIADAPGITTYGVQAQFRVGENPPFQFIEMDGVYGKDPEQYHLRISVTEQSRDPVTVEALLVDGQLYSKWTTTWVTVDKFNFEELIVLTPEHLLGIEGGLEEIGVEEHHGRKVVHLRGDKEDLPTVTSGSDSIDFSKMDGVVLDLWVDRDERFIAKLHIAAQAKMRGGLHPFDVSYEYSGFNEPITVNKPSSVVIPQTEMPPKLTQADVTGKLGFEFTLPEDANVLSITGATVSILTAMPIEDARTYAERAMRAAGFTPGTELERYPGEFYTDYTKGERTIGVLVFQVTESGATIKVGAPKL